MCNTPYLWFNFIIQILFKSDMILSYVTQAYIAIDHVCSLTFIILVVVLLVDVAAIHICKGNSKIIPLNFKGNQLCHCAELDINIMITIATSKIVIYILYICNC